MRRRLTAAYYSADPEATPLQGGDQYFDVNLSGASGVDSVDITYCDGDQYTLNWWNGTAWVVAQPQAYANWRSSLGRASRCRMRTMSRTSRMTMRST